MKSWTGVRARVWATRNHHRRIAGRSWRHDVANTWTWHYEVTRADGAVVLYDNTGDWRKIYDAARVRVEALEHMVIAGHDLPEYINP